MCILGEAVIYIREGKKLNIKWVKDSDKKYSWYHAYSRW